MTHELERNETREGRVMWPMSSNGTPSVSPIRAPGPLKWLPREPGSMGQLSACGFFSVCEIHIGDKVTFETWTREPLTGGMKNLAVGLDDWRDARKVAQADANKVAQKP